MLRLFITQLIFCSLIFNTHTTFATPLSSPALDLLPLFSQRNLTINELLDFASFVTQTPTTLKNYSKSQGIDLSTFIPKMHISKNKIFIPKLKEPIRILSEKPLVYSYRGNQWSYSPQKSFDQNIHSLLRWLDPNLKISSSSLFSSFAWAEEKNISKSALLGAAIGLGIGALVAAILAKIIIVSSVVIGGIIGAIYFLKDQGAIDNTTIKDLFTLNFHMVCDKNETALAVGAYSINYSRITGDLQFVNKLTDTPMPPPKEKASMSTQIKNWLIDLMNACQSSEDAEKLNKELAVAQKAGKASTQPPPAPAQSTNPIQ